MAQAKIYWDKNNYKLAERVLGKGREFCEESDDWRLNESWRLNVGHVLFMQKKYEASRREKARSARHQIFDGIVS